jgi:L-alanine-DL-glutamate epimerase-like enolase superfamily enzyme
MIDIALWDLKGKVVGLPLYKLLGGNQRKIPIYGSGGWTSYSEKELVEEMVAMVESGYSKVKMKVGVNFGQTPKEDERRVRAVRKALGDSVDLMIDANNVWTRATAIPFAHHLADCHLFWFEEPVLADDIEGLARISSQIHIPVASGEHEYTKYGAKELLTKQAADIIQMDVTKCGGITEWLKIAALTQAWNVPLAPHAMPYAHIHLVSAVPNALILEDLLIQKHADETFFIDLPQPKAGFLEIPDKPGLGLELNEKNLHKYNIS